MKFSISSIMKFSISSIISLLIIIIISSISAINILNENNDDLTTPVSPEELTQSLQFFLERISKDYAKSKSIDYVKLRNETFFIKNLKFIKRGLKTLDLKKLEEKERKAFFINIYNTLVLESLVNLPRIPNSLDTVPDFEYENGYKIGKKVYHLATIKHGVLRDNSPDGKTGKVYVEEDEKKFISLPKDPRIFAALFQASQSGPPLMSFSGDSLEEKLNEATHVMCDDGVRIKDDSNIEINSLFQDYLNDFATSTDNLLRWLSKCVEDTDKKIALYFAAVDKTFLSFSFQNFGTKIPKVIEEKKELKLDVDIYIESLCSDTHEFFQEQLLPSYEDFKRIVTLNIITFGKASVTPLNDGKDIEFECQHGPMECIGNKVVSCVVEYFPMDIQVPFLACLMPSPSIPKAIRECGKRTKVPVSAIEECYASSEGSLILYQNGLKTLELDPQLYIVPTVTLNKKYNSSTVQMATKFFSNFICKSFLESFDENQGIFTPSGCRVKLEVYIESLNPSVHKFFAEQLTPTWLRVGDSIDLNIIPYGNTSIGLMSSESKDITSRMKCSRGPFDCYGNVVMSCIIKLLPVKSQIRALSCMMKKKMPALGGKECVEQEGKEWKLIDACAEGEMGSNLILENKRKTEALSPKITSFPTITVNKINNSTFTEWALHDLTALVCDAFIVSKREEGRILLPKGCPVRVEIYLEMLCPDTKRFFLKVFYPSWKKLRSLIDLHLIPFGKANVWLSSDGKDYNFECQHGPLECKGNKVMSCIVEYLPTDLQVELIACMMQSPSPSDAGKQCAEELKISWAPLEKCQTTREGSEFLFQNGVRTMNLKPDFYFVPTITINKYYDSKQLQVSLNHFDDLLCAAYQKPFKHETKVLTPKGCKIQMELYFIGFSEESKSFLLNQLIPTWKLLHKVIDLKLFPVGRTSDETKNKVESEDTCRKESNCAGDLIFICAIKHFEIEDQLNFIECNLKANSSIPASKKCAQRFGLSWNTISNCLRNSESVNELEKNFRKTRDLRPTFHSIPTVLVNGQYSKQDLQKTKLELQNVICNSFYDPASLDEWKPEGCPITLEIFISSLCPESKRFFLSQIKQTWKTLNSILNLKIVPFGKASAKILNPDTEEYEFQCQHGPLECYGNKAMSCIVNHYSVNDQVQMIACMYAKEYPAIEGRECAEELGLNWQPIIDCIDTKGSHLLYQNGIKTQNVKPKLFYIPTAIVNGHYNKMTLRKSLRNLSGVVCSTYLKKMDSSQKAEIPEGCKVTVKIFFHSLNEEMKNFFSIEAEEFWRKFKRIVTIKFLPLKYLPNKELVEDCTQNRCYRTKVLGCFMEIHSTDIQMGFLACLMSQDSEENDIKICVTELNLNFEDLNHCATSEKSSKFLEDNQENFLKLQNPAKNFPFITIFKVALHDFTDLKRVTCQNFPGPSPQECEGIKI